MWGTTRFIILLLLSFVDKVIQAIEKGEYAVGVFLDFSKAFGTIDHDIMLDKLDHYGIRGRALSWFKSYLSCRTHILHMMEVNPTGKRLSVGYHKVQFWDHCFLWFTSIDLCTVCKNTTPVLFADDTNLFSSGLDATGIQDGVNHDLAIITEWLKANKLSLNIKKHIVFQQKTK